MLQVIRQNAEITARCSSPRLCKMLKQLSKSFLCFLLCTVIIFSSSYRRPAKAAMSGVLVTGGVIVAGCLAALGISAAVDCVVNGKTYGQACADIWNGLKEDIKTDVQGTVELVNNGMAVFKAQKNLLQAVFQGACQAIPQYSHFANVSSASDLCSRLGWDISKIVSSDSWTGNDIYFPSYDGWDLIGSGTVSSDMFNKTYPFVVNDSITVNLGFFATGLFFFNCAQCGYEQVYHWGRDVYITPGVKWAMFWTKFHSLNTSDDNKSCLFILADNGCGTMYSPEVANHYDDYVGSVPDVFNPASDKFYADGKSAMNTKVDDVINKAAEKVGQKDETTDVISIPITVPNVSDADDSDVISQSQSDVLGKDIADDADRDLNKETNKNRDTTSPKSSSIPDLSLPDILTKKFPFSLPWDLYNAVSVLRSPGEAPKFSVPIVVKSIGYSDTWDIDMSQFDSLAAIIRWGLSLLFLISLIILTNKLIKH